ncbi:MAG: DUF4177 domain-containing protein [Alphaproteobacteria bacterium]|nr:DUF4177 domain-containing protein [Alphaproteobacteria bacterium]
MSDQVYEYSVIPAPNRSEKIRDAKTSSDRYAVTITAELNRMAGEGWEYLRADVLPSEERSGLTGRTITYHNLLVFRRPKRAADAELKRLPQPSAAESTAPTSTSTTGQPNA